MLYTCIFLHLRDKPDTENQDIRKDGEKISLGITPVSEDLTLVLGKE